MDLLEFKAKPLLPLKRSSPSQYLSLRKCQLREIYSSSGFSLLPRSPMAHIGTAIHEMLELSVKGIIQSDEDFYNAWDNIINRIESKIYDNLLERHFVPLSLSVFNYEVKKVLTHNFMVSNNSSFPGTSQGRGDSAESWVKTNDGKIVGRIDLTKTTREGIEIIDYKTGKILEENGQVKLEYLDQLKMYSALYYETNGVWPTKQSIIGLNMEKIEVDVDKKECSDLLNDAKRKLNETNEFIEAGFPAEEFAKPRPENCRWCLYRPGCNEYWKVLKTPGDWPLDIRGQLKEKKLLLNSTFRITLQSNKEDYVIRGLAPDRHNYLNGDIKEVLLCNLQKDKVSGSYIEDMLTTGYSIK